MSQKKLLAVYILTYNREKYIGKCIESILQQSFENFDLFILDNASTDNTELVVKKFDDKRLHYIKHKENIGAVGNTVFAMNHCDYKYFVLFHDDDMMLPDMLKKEIYELEASENVQAVSVNADLIDSNDNVIGEFYSQSNQSNKTIYNNDEIIKTYLHSIKTLLFPSIMYRTSFIKKHNIYPRENAGPACDVLLYSDICLEGGSIVELSGKLMNYRIHPSQDSSSTGTKMNIQLLEYMMNDSIYHNIISNDVDGQINTVNFRVSQYVYLVLKKKMKYKNAIEEINRYKKIFQYNKIKIELYVIVLWMINVYNITTYPYYILSKGREN